MPKMKTHSGAKKRFKLTGTGKVKASHAMRSHILEKKSPKRKRAHAVSLILSPAESKRAKKLLGAKTR
jgi:large subunit ribosomal protein L35